MKSTSLHNLNAEKGLNVFQKSAYLILNWVNNLFPYVNLDKRMRIRNFNDESWEKEVVNTYETSSVGRRLSDIFWRILPWEKIKEELGEINIFDTGCGQGNYSWRIEQASGNRISSYIGIDSKRRPNWDELKNKHPNFQFIESSSSDITALIPREANLFVTQSAIEHFDEDMKFFEQLKGYIDKTGKPVIKIHNFPAKAALPLYLFHGIRQYTPRTISKITKLFKDADIYLYGLGGEAGKKVQWKYFTWPKLIKRGEATWSKDPDKYNREVIEAIKKDMKNPSCSPLFWVLIIHSHPKTKIW